MLRKLNMFEEFTALLSSHDEKIDSVETDKFGAYEPWLSKTGYVFTCIFFLASFLSKAALNISGGLVLLCALIYVMLYGRNVLKDVCGLKYLIVPACIGAVVALFSNDGGPVASLEFLNRMKFLFVPFFLGVFVRSRKQLYVVVTCLVISGLLATLYGFWNSYQLQFGQFHGYYKLDRSASLILTMCLALMAILLEGWRDMSGKWRWVLLGLAVLFHWQLVMCSIRGAWLGYVVGVVLILLAIRSRMVVSFFAVVVVGLALVGAGNNPIKNEVVSIFDLKTNASNNARLHLWRGGLDFSKEQLLFGAGVKGVKKQYAEFFSKQSDAYKKTYHYADKYHADFHNNYIQILVESGLLTLAALLGGFGGLLWLLYKKIATVSGLERGVVLAAFSVTGGFLVKQFFHMQLTSYGSVAFYLVLFAGMSFASMEYECTPPTDE